MAKLISDAARDLIVAEEVSSKATYEKKYTHPEWPGGSSGVTIGIGYDIGAGVKNRDQLWADWKGHIPDAMISALEPCIGVQGERAHAMLAQVRGRVTVPWQAAIDVFDNVDVPRWSATVRKYLPNCDLLSLDSFGALVSLTYNRGPSFDNTDDRFREMRAIKAHMAAKRFDRIPAELRSMARLWPKMPGLQKRRDNEARLFERGLSANVVTLPVQQAAPAKIPPPPDVEPTPPKPAQPASGGLFAGAVSLLASLFKKG